MTQYEKLSLLLLNEILRGTMYQVNLGTIPMPGDRAEYAGQALEWTKQAVEVSKLVMDQIAKAE